MDQQRAWQIMVGPDRDPKRFAEEWNLLDPSDAAVDRVVTYAETEALRQFHEHEREAIGREFAEHAGYLRAQVKAGIEARHAAGTRF